MRRLALLFALLTWAVPACAQDHAATLMEPPAWVLKPTPAIDCNFALGAYYNCPLDKTFSVTRTSTKYCQWLTGIWMSVASGAPCITDQGWLIEEARTNDALQSRDMTQAVWVSVGMTEALNAVGIDGVANSASTLTATGTAGSCTASCTDLQTITLGSSADTYSVWLKRVTGSGTVNITINNLGAVTPCTLVATGFTRCTVTATLANPVIGIQMTVVNDVIVADFNQMEPGGFPTSPILTTSASATRAADNVVAAGLFASVLGAGTGAAFVQVNIPTSATSFPRLWDQNVAVFAGLISTPSGPGQINVNNVAVNTVNNVTFGSVTRYAANWSPLSQAVVINGGAVATGIGGAPTTGAINIGNNSALNRGINGKLLRFTLFNFLVPNAQLQMLTSLN